MAAEPVQAPLHRLDLDTYNAIVASGALEGQHVELLLGTIVDMSPQSAEHATVLRRLAWHFAGTRLQVQAPLEVPPSSEPEPDLAVIGAEPPAGEHPHTALIVIEVAVSSHAVDRGVKAKLYAQAQIPTYWLVDMPARTVEVRTQPEPSGYSRLEVHGEGEIVPCPLEGVADLSLAELLAGFG